MHVSKFRFSIEHEHDDVKIITIQTRVSIDVISPFAKKKTACFGSVTAHKSGRFATSPYDPESGLDLEIFEKFCIANQKSSTVRASRNKITRPVEITVTLVTFNSPIRLLGNRLEYYPYPTVTTKSLQCSLMFLQAVVGIFLLLSTTDRRCVSTVVW